MTTMMSGTLDLTKSELVGGGSDKLVCREMEINFPQI